MVDNYLPIFNIEKQKLKEKNIEENLNRLLTDVSQEKKYISEWNVSLVQCPLKQFNSYTK